MTLAGRPQLAGFELHERIGAGGFGEVYRARQTSVGRDVAIKVVRPTLANEADFIRRFDIEAQLVASLEHPHICPLYDYWRGPDGAFLVMRYFPLGSLADRLTEGALDPRDAANTIDQIAEALDLAHRNGVVHRDVKPSNVLLDADGHAFLTDFGIARSSRLDDDRTLSATFSGSPGYAAPEQSRGKPSDPRTDIYNLGLVASEMLAGRHPFAGDTPAEPTARHVHDPVPSLDAVIARATAEDPSDRFSSAPSMARAFRAATEHAKLRESQPSPVRRSVKRLSAPNDFSEGREGNPYVGLRPFGVMDSNRFYGRERLVERLVDRLATDGDRFLALVGPSGSGKSSLLHAGLLPAMRAGAINGSDRWFVTTMRPGPDPFSELELAISRVAVRPGRSLSTFEAGESPSLVDVVNDVLPAEDAELVLVIDGFEELFTLPDDVRTARRFLDLLHASARDPQGRVRTIIALRADFYDRPLGLQPFAGLMRQNVETVVPLTRDELERAIRQPALDAGYRFESGLVARIANDVQESPAGLPLMQFALMRLVNESSGSELTTEAFDDIGGVSGALAQRAETAFRTSSEVARNEIRRLILRLVAWGEDDRPTRKSAARTDLLAMAEDTSLMDDVIERLANERLLTLDHARRTREPTVHLAHEALISAWPRLADWLGHAREDLILDREVIRAASAWENAGRDESFLMQGKRLERFDDWPSTADFAIRPLERDFLAASRETRAARLAREREQREREERLRRRSRNVLASLAGVLLVAATGASLLAAWADGQRKEAVVARSEAEARAAALLASEIGSRIDDGDAALAVLLGLAGLDRFGDHAALEAGLHRAVASVRPIQQLQGHSLAAIASAWSPTGDRLATAGQDTLLRIWDPETGSNIVSISLPSDLQGTLLSMGLDVAWSPDGASIYVLIGDRYLTAGGGMHLARFDARTGQELARSEVPRSLSGEQPTSSRPTVLGRFPTAGLLAIEPDSGRPAVASLDGKVRIWSPELDAIVASYEMRLPPELLTFSRSGRRLAVGLAGGGIDVIETETGLTTSRMPGHAGTVSSLAWHPGGAILASTGSDGTVRTWNAISGEQRWSLPGTTEPHARLGWLDDSMLLAVTSSRGGITLLSPNGERRGSFPHGDVLLDLDVPPGDDQIATTDASGAVSVIGLTPEWEAAALPFEQVGPFAWDRSTLWAAVTLSDGTRGIARWHAEHDAPSWRAWRLDAIEHVSDIAVSADGRRLAIATAAPLGQVDEDERSSMLVLDAASGQLLHRLESRSRAPISAVAWSPDGSVLLTATSTGIIELRSADGTQIDRSVQLRERIYVKDVSWSSDGSRFAAIGQGGRQYQNVKAVAWDRASLRELNAPNIDGFSQSIAWQPSGSSFAVGLEPYAHSGTTSVGLALFGSDGPELPLIEALAMEGDPATSPMNGATGVATVSWSPDGQRLAGIDTRGMLRIWTMPELRAVANIDTGSEGTTAIAWSSDGRWLAIGSGPPYSGKVVRAFMTTEHLVDFAASCCVWRELSPAERQRFGLMVSSDTALTPVASSAP